MIEHTTAQVCRMIYSINTRAGASGGRSSSRPKAAGTPKPAKSAPPSKSSGPRQQGSRGPRSGGRSRTNGVKNSQEMGDVDESTQPASKQKPAATTTPKKCDGPNGCFVAGTQVVTDDGLKPIEEIQVGDRVLAYDPVTHVQEYKVVTQTFVREVRELVHVVYRVNVGRRASRGGSHSSDKTGGSGNADDDGGGAADPDGRLNPSEAAGESAGGTVLIDDDGYAYLDLVTTTEHPFWSETWQCWEKAIDLQPGQQLRLENGSTAVVESVLVEHAESALFTVYNMEVADAHSYFVLPEVGAGYPVGAAICVHNKPCPVMRKLQGAARAAVRSQGSGSGHAYGSRVHKKFADNVDRMGDRSLKTEIAFKNGRRVTVGTAGSVRLDVVRFGPNGKTPVAVYDLKTGSARLSSARMRQIQMHVPNGRNIPILEVRP